LRKFLANANGFRFFSSSLLIAFDAERENQQSPENDGTEITVKMIDFAHSTFNGFLDDAPYSGIDEGYILGIDSMINFLTMFLQVSLI
jgi:inositol-hexakisphosphate 5-kinase